MSYEALAGELFSLMCHAPSRQPPAIPGSGFRGQFIVLRCLHNAGGHLFAGDLAAALHVTSGRIATAIKRLEAVGYVTKEKSDADGRRTCVVLTDCGREALLSREAQLREFLTSRLSCLTEAEAAEYVRLSRKITESP